MRHQRKNSLWRNRPAAHFSFLLMLTIALAGCGGSTGGNSASARAKDNGDIVVEYRAVNNQEFETYQKLFREAQLHQKVAEAFNSSYALPEDLTLRIGKCGVTNAFYNPRDTSINMCYEMYSAIAKVFKSSSSNISDERLVEVSTQTWSWILFHELAHAVIDLYDIEILGREEDAADGLSTVLFTEADSPEFAISAASFFRQTAGQTSPAKFADEHSLSMQRFFNILCWVYGSNPDQNQGILQEFPQLEDRAAKCPGQYQDKLQGWNERLSAWKF